MRAIYECDYAKGMANPQLHDYEVKEKQDAERNISVGMSADQAVGLTDDELCQIPEIEKQIKEGEKQVKEYGKKLEQKYGNLRLQKFVVVALGFKAGQWIES
jgi:hypothetical protein